MTSTEENTRITSVRELMTGKGCTHALVTDAIDVEYISGFRASSAALLITGSRLELLTDFRYKEAAKAFCKGRRGWKFTLTDNGIYDALKKRVNPGSGAKIAFQSDIMTVDEYRRLRKIMTGSKLVPLSETFSDISVGKRGDEIDSMRKAAAIGDRAFKTLLPLIKTSASEVELARLLERICADFGSEKPAFDTIVLFGGRAALPHGRPSGRKPREGDVILLDFGCVKDGFRSDMTRTLVYGKASDECRNIYDIVLRAQTAACAAALPGVKAQEVDAVARGVIRKSGYAKCFGHAIGHGVGLRIHETPRLHKKNETELIENSVITIEPGIYVPDLCGVRIEDMLVLKTGGAELLTHSPKNLMELPVL